MKLKLKLDERKTDEKKAKFVTTHIFVPTHKDWVKKVKLVIASPDPIDDLGNLGLPSSLDDTVILEFLKKEEQTKLGTAEKKKKED